MIDNRIVDVPEWMARGLHEWLQGVAATRGDTARRVLMRHRLAPPDGRSWPDALVQLVAAGRIVTITGDAVTALDLVDSFIRLHPGWQRPDSAPFHAWMEQLAELEQILGDAGSPWTVDLVEHGLAGRSGGETGPSAVLSRQCATGRGCPYSPRGRLADGPSTRAAHLVRRSGPGCDGPEAPRPTGGGRATSVGGSSVWGPGHERLEEAARTVRRAMSASFVAAEPAAMRVPACDDEPGVCCRTR